MSFPSPQSPGRSFSTSSRGHRTVIVQNTHLAGGRPLYLFHNSELDLLESSSSSPLLNKETIQDLENRSKKKARPHDSKRVSMHYNASLNERRLGRRRRDPISHAAVIVVNACWLNNIFGIIHNIIGRWFGSSLLKRAYIINHSRNIGSVSQVICL
jgi:hypothetical protein